MGEARVWILEEKICLLTGLGSGNRYRPAGHPARTQPIAIPNLTPRIPTRKKTPRYMGIEEDLLYKEIPSPSRNEGYLYATIKTPNPSQTKIRIIFPSSGTLEL